MNNLTYSEFIFLTLCFIVPILGYSFIKYLVLSFTIEEKHFVHRNRVYYVIPKKYCQELFKEGKAPDDFRTQEWPPYAFEDSLADYKHEDRKK